jgi:beta-aspartyl-peptidase (threonine type)
MRRGAAVAIAFLCAGFPAAPRSEAGTAGTGAVRAVLDAQVQAWNRGDLEGFMAGYWNSPDLVFHSGATVTRGWQATLDRYRKRYQGEGKEMGRLRFEEVEVQMLGPDAALARGRWHLVRKDGSEPNGLFTLVVRRFHNGWKIVHDHTS